MANFTTAATIISRAARQLGLVTADIANPYASDDPNVLQLCALLDEAGRELVREHQWSHLRSTYTFSTSNGTQTYDLPSGFDRLVDGTVWNQTTDTRGCPISEQQYQRLLATGAAATAFNYFIKQDLFHIYPVPTSTDTVGYAFQTGFWAGGTTSPSAIAATAAADKIWFDPPLIVALLKLRFLEAKGFNTDSAQRAFDRALSMSVSSDGVAPALHLAGPRGVRVYDPAPVDTLDVTS